MTRLACVLAVLATACRPFEEAPAGADVRENDAGVLRATILVDDPSSTTVTQLRGTKSSLFWIAGGARVKRTDKLSGGVTTVLEAKTVSVHGGGIPSITTDGATLFAIVYGLGADPFCRNVMTVDEGTARDLGYGCGQGRALATFERFVYFGNWSEVGDDVLHEIDTTTKNERKLVLGANEQVRVTCAAGGRVYFASEDRSTIRYAATTTFDAVTPFASGFGTLATMACDEAGVVWATTSGKLFSQRHAATTPSTLTSGLDDPHALVLEGPEVYVATAAADRGQHWIRTVPRVGGGERSIWRAPDRIDSFVVDANAIFVAAAPRTIFRIDR